MRLIDADALSGFVGDLRSTLLKEQSTFKAMTPIEFNTRDYMLLNFQQIIDNAPTVVKESLTSERPTGEWIPVSERLPEEDDDYIVSFIWKDGEEEVGKSWYNTRFGFTYDNVIAWMPLPEPYKKGGEEE